MLLLLLTHQKVVLMRFISFALAYFLVFLSIYVLWAASSFFIPLAIAFVASYLIIAFAEGIRRYKVFGKPIPTFLAFIISLSFLGLGVYFIFNIIEKNVFDLIERSPLYQQRFSGLLTQASTNFKFEFIDLVKIINKFDFSEILKDVLYVATQIISNTGIIVIYILFFLIEYGYYESKIKALFPDPANLEKARKITHRIASQIQSYLKIKTWLSLLTAILSYIVLKAVGVDFAEFWALLFFLLNYIPTFGSIIATTFPCLLAFVQFDSVIPFIVVTSVLVSIQMIIGNVIEPRIMGSQFNLSPLVILLSLVIWGKIWGVIGVFLCVPLLMILSIVLANFSRTRPIAVLLSQNGRVE
jgi:AI-2 transport protein TqsA